MNQSANGPKVSVIMATFNAADTVDEALESIAAQTYENWELVVCDDASTDDTLQHLEVFARKYEGRVVVLRNEVNSKLSFSLNRCLEHASGELIARMDADDRSVPERFAKQVDFLASHEGTSVVGTAMQRFDSNGLKDVLELAEKPDRWSMRHGVPFAHATVMVRKEAYEALGGYTVSRRTERGQDYDLWFRFFAAGFQGANLPEPLYQVREDEAAIKRRTFTVRWRSYQTTLIGFKLLGYPKRWYIRPTLALAKGLVPYKAIAAYRAFQAKQNSELPLIE